MAKHISQKTKELSSGYELSIYFLKRDDADGSTELFSETVLDEIATSF